MKLKSKMICRSGKWLVAKGGVGECARRVCEDDEVRVGGECVNMFKAGACPLGERLYHDERREGVCDCREGWGREAGERWGRCYQEFTRGFCPDGQIIKIVRGGLKLKIEDKTGTVVYNTRGTSSCDLV